MVTVDALFLALSLLEEILGWNSPFYGIFNFMQLTLLLGSSFLLDLSFSIIDLADLVLSLSDPFPFSFSESLVFSFFDVVRSDFLPLSEVLSRSDFLSSVDFFVSSVNWNGY